MQSHGEYKRFVFCSPGLQIVKELCVDKEPLLLTATSCRIAERFDIVASKLCPGKGHDTCAPLHHYYGAGLFCCPIPSCCRHGFGFETRDGQEAHAAKHQRLFKCGVMDCDFSSIGFESEADRADHMSNCHNLAREEELAWEDMDDESCFRVLCSAARQGEFGLVQSLLSLISEKIIDLGGFGELFLAAGEGQSAGIINLVISACKSVHETMARGHSEEASKRLNEQLQETLNDAVRIGSEALVSGLCCSKILRNLNYANQGSKGRNARLRFTPLHLAILGRSESIVEQLLDSGANIDAPSKDGTTPLHLAAKKGEEAAARLLLSRGANLEARDATGRTALQLAAKFQHMGTARLLLSCGADLEARDVDGWTALHFAAGYGRGHEDTARLLLDHGADIEARDSMGCTALRSAASLGCVSTARLLLSRGADPEAKTNYGSTALHKAAQRGNDAVVRLLLDRGADIKAWCTKGWTALHYVANSHRAHESTVQLLLDRGAEIKAKTYSNSTALDIATGCRNEAIARRLRNPSFIDN